MCIVPLLLDQDELMFDCSNLEQNSLYYKKTMLIFIVNENGNLFKDYKNVGHFKVIIVMILMII